MYFARLHPDMVKKVVTLDNLRVPFVTDGKIKILSFRSKDPVFKADPGVVPDDEVCAKGRHHGGENRVPAQRPQRSRSRER
jgi:hypothetical protein